MSWKVSVSIFYSFVICTFTLSFISFIHNNL